MYIQCANGNWIGEILGNILSPRGPYLYRITLGSQIFCKNGEHEHTEAFPATEQQIAHLKACIAADKFVEWNDNMLITNYEIY